MRLPKWFRRKRCATLDAGELSLELCGPWNLPMFLLVTRRVDDWWLCPNEPRCPHGAALHDIEGDLEWADDIPTCCADGCDCGRNGAVRMT